MPPLLRQVIAAAGRGDGRARELLLPALADGLRCFEMTGVAGLLADPSVLALEELQLFWPASPVWIEQREWPEVGHAACLVMPHICPQIDFTAITRQLRAGATIKINLEDEAPRGELRERAGAPPSIGGGVVTMLALVGAPSIPGRMHRPPLGLARRLRRAGLLPAGGKLSPWTEILAPPAPQSAA
ncbi:MAG TPA: hypothetical protein VGM07_06195 [Stellaceae bacterium]|jgi:hypothetical protein